MPAPVVTYADGENASGMATMLGGLLEENFRDYPGRARIASLARGALVLTASDRDISVTLSFNGTEVVVTNGPSTDTAVLAGPWLDMAKLCSGQINPFKAIVGRVLTIEPQGGVHTMAAAGYVLSVPASFYDDEDEAAVRLRRRRRAVAATAATGAVATVAYISLRGRLAKN